MILKKNQGSNELQNTCISKTKITQHLCNFRQIYSFIIITVVYKIYIKNTVIRKYDVKIRIVYGLFV